jgi:hypothetical protein
MADRWTEDRAYGAGDYTEQRWGRDHAGRRAAEDRHWRAYEPGHDSPAWREESGPRWRFDGPERYHDGRRESEWRPQPGERPHHRGFWDRAADEVATWWGDRDAEARREADGRHRGAGPRGYRRSDARIDEDVHDQLTEDAWLDASDITVRVEDGRVELRGQVRTEDDRRRAGEIADRVAGVTAVDNDLRVWNGGREDWTQSGLYPF